MLAGARTGFGLASMNERLRLFGGQAEIDAHPGSGTRVRLFLPYIQPVKGNGTQNDSQLTQ
jgi:signal transduction histidine kinase